MKKLISRKRQNDVSSGSRNHQLSRSMNFQWKLISRIYVYISNDDRVDVEFRKPLIPNESRKDDWENIATFSGHTEREIVSRLFRFRPNIRERFLLPSKFIQSSLCLLLVPTQSLRLSRGWKYFKYYRSSIEISFRRSLVFKSRV